MTYGEGRYGLGQILARYGQNGGHFYFGVFQTEYGPDDPGLEAVTSDRFALFALSMDALLYHEYWPIIGSTPVPNDAIRWPESKIATAPGHYVVEDAFGEVLRTATAKDVALLPYRTVVAPIRLQHAFEALHGARNWEPEYDALRVSGTAA